MSNAANRLTKWRTIFAAWQLKGVMKGTAESDAVRDHRELSMLMRAELNAWGYLFIEKGLITREEFNTRFDIECDLLSKDYEKKFPGFKACDYGMTMEPPHIATDTMSGWTK